MLESVKYSNSGRFISNGSWQHPRRSMDTHELLFVVKGCVYIQENDVAYALQKNDLLVLEPHLTHFGFRPSTDVSFYWLHWSGDTPHGLPKRYTAENGLRLSILFRQLLHGTVSKSFPECNDYLTRLILAEVMQSAAPTPASKTVDRVAAWIRANRYLPLQVSDVASHFGYHPDYLNRLFQKHFQKSTKAYINEMRLGFIKEQLLNSDLSLTEIAFASGFSEYKYFLKFFQYHEGVTPTEFCSAYSKIKLNTK